jgi:hypothetical protein
MSTLRSIIPGKLISEREALRELEKLPKPRRGSTPPPPTDPATFTMQNGFYQIDKSYLLTHTGENYRRFLKESGYGDLEAGSGLEVAKGILKLDSVVRTAASSVGITVAGNDRDYVENINHPTARKLVERLGYKVLPTGLMYHVVIPYLKDLVSQNNPDAQATLQEMINTKAEWLEDIIQNKQDVHIGSKHQRLAIQNTDGRFDHVDMNEFGYPTIIKSTGEFYYWYPRGNEQAAIRDRGSELGLSLSRGPSLEGVGLGVRLAKILP